MSLTQWLANGWLRAHKPSRNEIRDLLAVADRDLADCEASGLSPDWQLNIAYNAALQVAAAALAAEGYRAERELHHYRTLQSLEFTLGLDAATLRQLDLFRKKRNISDYERAHAVSEAEAGEMKALAHDLRDRIEPWLRKKHPELV